MNINGMETDLVIKMTGIVSEGATVAGAEDNRIKPSNTVVCDQDGDGFDDDCLNLPENSGMVARYTVTLEQISPDTNVGLVAIYDELPEKFAFRAGTVASPDNSFPEILSVTPTNIGTAQKQIMRWDLSTSPVYFQQDELKTFTFEADIPDKSDRYCNGIFLKLEVLPNEKSSKATTVIAVNTIGEGCKDGGTAVAKYVDKLVARPKEPTIFTYIVNVENIDSNTLHIASMKDVLPQGGFQWCDPANPPSGLLCEAPMYKIVDNPFDPVTGDFTDTTGFTNLNDSVETYDTVDDRWQLFWDGPGGSGWNISQPGQAGDTFIMRFQAQFTATGSGTYYN